MLAVQFYRLSRVDNRLSYPKHLSYHGILKETVHPAWAFLHSKQQCWAHREEIIILFKRTRLIHLGTVRVSSSDSGTNNDYPRFDNIRVHALIYTSMLRKCPFGHLHTLTSIKKDGNGMQDRRESGFGVTMTLLVCTEYAPLTIV